MIPCDYPECPIPAAHQCECCDSNFCTDHGTRGGDREGGEGPRGPYGAYAVPNACWKCGGFNADA